MMENGRDLPESIIHLQTTSTSMEDDCQLTPFNHYSQHLKNPDNIYREEKYFPTALYGSHLGWSHNSYSNNLLNLMLNLEKYCNGTMTYPFYDPRPKHSINVSLKDAIRSPQIICTRTPYDNSRDQVLNLKNLTLMWCRMVSHYFDWTAGIPDLLRMAEEDRISLCVHQLCKVICFTLSFATYEHNCDGLLFAGGIYFPPNFHKSNIQPEIQNYVGRLYEVIRKKVIPIFQDLQFTFEEYVLVKLLLFFGADTAFLGEDQHNSRGVIGEATKKYRHALIEHQKSRYPYMSTYEIGLRLVRMYSIFSFMEILHELDQSSLAELVVLNKGNLQGELTFDIHVRTTRNH
ncbi:unnamed protein product, partial [Mesorhabditis belari]|uniref:NR LBD domain-containing protein n=1 Tax=Mesorhabditis belari TaxID=2138241 RepID=A0AAF3FMV3_9BILA